MSWVLHLIKLVSKMTRKKSGKAIVEDKNDSSIGNAKGPEDDSPNQCWNPEEESERLYFPFEHIFSYNLLLFTIVCRASVSIRRSELTISFSLFVEDNCIFEGKVYTKEEMRTLYFKKISIGLDQAHKKYRRLKRKNKFMAKKKIRNCLNPIQAFLDLLKPFPIMFSLVKFSYDESEGLDELPMFVRNLVNAIENHSIEVKKLSIFMPMRACFLPLISAAYDQGCRWFRLSHAMSVRGVDSEDSERELSIRWIRKLKLFEDIFGTGPEANARYAAAVEVMSDPKERYNENISKKMETKDFYVFLHWDPIDFEDGTTRRRCYLVPTPSQ